MVAIAAAPRVRSTHGLWWDAGRRFAHRPSAMIGLAIVTSFALIALLIPLVLPIDTRAADLSVAMQPPSWEHPMGTDALGRDYLARVLHGTRPSLRLGVLAVLIGLLIGGAIGILASTGAIADALLMRVVDMLLTIPGILLAILIVAWLGHTELPIMLAVGMRYTPVFARLLRGSLLALASAEFVVAAHSTGASDWRVLSRHALPNAVGPTLVQAALAAGTAVIDVAGIGFLGLGPGDPRVAEWGEMLTGSERYLQAAPYIIAFPALAVVLTAIGFNLAGDGLREALDPRLRS
jgi:peptide/nickel transport system permease protein